MYRTRTKEVSVSVSEEVKEEGYFIEMARKGAQTHGALDDLTDCRRGDPVGGIGNAPGQGHCRAQSALIRLNTQC